MQVFVRTSEASTMGFELIASESIVAFKSRIEVTLGVPMNRQQLVLHGQECEEETVVASLARAADRNPSLGTKAMLDLLRREGADAVDALVQESRTFDLIEQTQPSHFLRMRCLKDQAEALSSGSTNAGSGCSGTWEPSSDCQSVQSFSSVESEPRSKFQDLIAENQIRTAKLRQLMSDRRKMFN